MSQLTKIIAVFFFAMLSLLSVDFSAAQTEGKKPQFGTYSKEYLDMEVKVSGGFIRVWRVWQGGKKRWAINPQHDPLELKDLTYSEEYQRLVAAEISRGGKNFFGVTLLTSKGGRSSSGDGAGSSADAGAQRLVRQTVAGINVQSCYGAAGQGQGVVVNAEGYKYITGIGHEWAQYNRAGIISAWGVGDQRVGVALYDDRDNLKGYSNNSGEEVVSIGRDPQGRIHTISDNSGRTVTYNYNNDGLIEEVIDVDGNVTKYSYQNGNLTRIEEGDLSESAAEKQGEGTRHYISYYSDGRVKSVLDDEGLGTTYQHDYDKTTKTFIETQKISGNRSIRRYVDESGAAYKIERNDRPYFRLVQICEDSAIIDQNNSVTYFDRDGYGRLQKVIYPDRGVTTYEHTIDFWPNLDKPWDTPGKPWGITRYRTPEGRDISYVRDKGGRILEANEAFESGQTRKWKFTYDNNGNLTSQRLQGSDTPDDRNDRIDGWTYDQYGNPKSYTNSNNLTWRFEFNKQGLLTDLTEPGKGSWKFSYTPSGKIKYTRDPIGFETFYEYTKRGLLARYREVYDEGKEAVYRYQYNRRGLLTRMIDPFGKEWIYEYDEAGDLRQSKDPLGNIESWTYDRDGRVKTYTDASAVTISYDYFDSSFDNAIQTSTPFPPLVRITYPTFIQELQYDLRKRLIADSKKSPTGEVHRTSYVYDADNRITKITLPDSREVAFSYDKLGRVVTTTSTGQGTMSVSYDISGRDIKYSHPLYGTFQQLFDRSGNLIEESYPNGKKLSYAYDPKTNELSTISNTHGDKVKYQFDIANRLTAIELSKNLPNAPPNEVRRFEYNLRGDLLKHAVGATSTTYVKDEIGRIVSAVTDFGPFSRGHSYSYFANGDLESFTGPDNLKIQYGWEPNGSLRSVSIPNEGAITYQYNKTDWLQPEGILFPGGSNERFGYDDLRRIKSLSSRSPTNIINFSQQFDYDPGHSVPSSKTTEAGAYSYGWDSAKRLSSVDTPDGSKEEFRYDELSRRSPLNSTWTYNSDGGVLNADGTTYTYDSQGNRTSKTIGSAETKYNYTLGDRLASVESPPGTELARYSYNALEQRSSKEIQGQATYFYYTDEGLSAEFDTEGRLVRSYLYNPTSGWANEPLAMKVPGAGFQYFHNDALGTPQKLINKNNTVTWAAKYSAFGKAQVTTQTFSNPIRFPGQYEDSESGLHQNYFRDYDPAIGAYTTNDPYGVLITGFNRHVYAGGNPVTLSDSTGEIVPAIIIAVGYALVVMDVVYTGYQFYQCYEYTQDPCAHPEWDDSCFQAKIGAALLVGTGGVGAFFKPIGKGLIGARGWLRGVRGLKGVERINPTAIRFSQSSVNGVEEIAASMRVHGWQGAPIDVVRMSDGALTTFDNTRMLAASRAGIDVQAVIRGAGEAFPSGRWAPKSGIQPTNWEQAVHSRIQQQNRLFRQTYPNGSPFTGSAQ